LRKIKIIIKEKMTYSKRWEREWVLSPLLKTAREHDSLTEIGSLFHKNGQQLLKAPSPMLNV